MRMLRGTITMPGTGDGDGDCATRNDSAQTSPGCSIMRIIDPYSSVSELTRTIKKEIHPGN